MPAGPRFADALRRGWDEGDAVLPLDMRLSEPAKARVLETMRPSVIVDASGDSVSVPGGEPVEEGDALVVATSGTTGEQKGVVLTHAAVEASARATSARLGVDPARDRWLACLPFAHVGGLSVLTRAMLTGTPVEIQPRFTVAQAVAAARDRGATLVSLVPTALDRLGSQAASAFPHHRRRRPAATRCDGGERRVDLRDDRDRFRRLLRRARPGRSGGESPCWRGLAPRPDALALLSGRDRPQDRGRLVRHRRRRRARRPRAALDPRPTRRPRHLGR